MSALGGTAKLVNALEGFRLIEQGVVAKRQQHYEEVADRVLGAAEDLDAVPAIEVDVAVRRLLRAKASVVVGWAEGIVVDATAPRGPTRVPPRRSKDNSIPTTVSAAPSVGRDETEQTNMHYTPVLTRSPSKFSRDGYQLQVLRRHRMLIVITTYDEIEIEATLRKVGNNVADGRAKASASTLTQLRETGVYDEDTLRIMSAGLTTSLHLFEKTLLLPEASGRPFNFALKEENAGKLHSLFWFFHGFCTQVDLRPKHVARTYRAIGAYYMVLVVLTTATSVLTLVHTGAAALSPKEIALGIAVFGVYVIAAACHCKLHHIMLSFVQDSLLLPVMIVLWSTWRYDATFARSNTLSIYSFCNLLDLSWGTKGIDSSHDVSSDANKNGENKDVVARQRRPKTARNKQPRLQIWCVGFDSFRSNLLSLWLVSNAALVGGLP
ncbi:hypothetical protein SDRG_17157 [Saprolegnia diclina VS20]|uniref:chitin synthase n=1 Tax=Saprolegnia diclina (strain VS20) TaxID=1156394 RepID=T0R645_SAPDV|nr:hypothetical protein SDRG_17157 [Saprolegnia diclina VS20]EQC24952.1 hypothetical protein SDRG_17157 [Saprolegnia diclina VS20]|eukprot:XP_008621616.1 hypothetical protein SDRG_17157 [Saprolegnia diclina VS20]